MGAAVKRKLSHYDSKGGVRMVDVSEKPPTTRAAEAHAFVRMLPATVRSIRQLKNPRAILLKLRGSPELPQPSERPN